MTAYELAAAQAKLARKDAEVGYQSAEIGRLHTQLTERAAHENFAKVGEGHSIGKYRKGQAVFSQGEPADAVFYILSGKIKVTVASKQGKEAVIAILSTDEFVGEGCLAGQPAHIYRIGDNRLSRCPVGEVCHQADDPREAGVLRDVHGPSSQPQHAGRSRSPRPDVQFQREAARTAAPAVGEFRQGGQAGADDREDQPGNACRHGRHHTGARQLLH